MQTNSGKLPQLALTATAVIFGFSFLFTKSALDSLGVFELLGLRFLTAALLLTVLKLTRVIRIDIDWSGVRELLIVALFQPIMYFIFETLGVGLTSASESSIIISLVPISITILAVFLLKERIRLSQWLYISVSVAGVIVIVLAKGATAGQGQLMGVAALIGAVIAAGLYNVYSRKVSFKYTPLEITYIMMWVGAVVFNVIGIGSSVYNEGRVDYFLKILDFQVLGGILFLGIVSSVGAFFFLNYAISKMEASKTAVYMNLIPVVSVAAGVCLKGESFYPMQYAGAALILIGIWGINRR